MPQDSTYEEIWKELDDENKRLAYEEAIGIIPDFDWYYDMLKGNFIPKETDEMMVFLRDYFIDCNNRNNELAICKRIKATPETIKIKELHPIYRILMQLENRLDNEERMKGYIPKSDSQDYAKKLNDYENYCFQTIKYAAGLDYDRNNW